jgi:hypothetical protein
MSSSSEGGVVERMRPIDAIPDEPLHWPRVAPPPFDGCCTIACNAIATEPACFEALNDLAALNPVGIRLIGTGHDETGTTGRAAEISIKDDEARGDRSR